MALPYTSLLADFSTPDPGDFVWDDPVLGLFDTGGVFSAGGLTDLSDALTGSLTVKRGRSSMLDDIAPSSVTITIDDVDRSFDPLNTGSPYTAADLAPGRQVQILSHGVEIFTGRLAELRIEDEANAPSMVTWVAEDALAALGRRLFLEWTTTEQLAGARIEAVLDRAEVAFSDVGRDIDAGASTLQSDLVTWGSNVLSYLQLVARSDLGRFFASRMGIPTFRDRRSGITGVVLSMTDDGTGAEPSRVIRASSIRDSYNRVSIDREGGTAQTAALSSSEILAQGGTRTLSLGGLLLNSDTDSADMAAWLLAILSTDEQRIREVQVDIHGLDYGVAQMLLSLDIGDRFSLSYTPGIGGEVGDEISATLVVEGLQHTITPFSQSLALYVSQASLVTPLIFDDAEFGFDSGLFIY